MVRGQALRGGRGQVHIGPHKAPKVRLQEIDQVVEPVKEPLRLVDLGTKRQSDVTD
jgi:hypothetical protein